MAYSGCDGDRVDVIDSTVVANIATSAVGGIWVGCGDSGSTLTSSILAGNTGAGVEFNIGGTIHSGGFNVVGNNYSGAFAPLATDIIGTYPASVDPMLVALADNGGRTYTMALQVGSPALARNTACAGGTDQRGVTRPAGACDAGSYQLTCTPDLFVPLICPAPAPAMSPVGLLLAGVLLAGIAFLALRRRITAERVG